MSASGMRAMRAAKPADTSALRNSETANATRTAQPLNYRVEWLDKEGFPIQGAVVVARTITVPALGYETAVAVATHPKARKFRIELTEINGAKAVR